MVRAPQPELGTFPGQPSGLARGLGEALPAFRPPLSPGPARSSVASFSHFSLFLKPGLAPSLCRWRERSWARRGPACRPRRLNAVCDCVTDWSLAHARPRAARHLQVFFSKQPLSALSWTPLGREGVGRRRDGRGGSTGESKGAFPALLAPKPLPCTGRFPTALLLLGRARPPGHCPPWGLAWVPEVQGRKAGVTADRRQCPCPGTRQQVPLWPARALARCRGRGALPRNLSQLVLFSTRNPPKQGWK